MIRNSAKLTIIIGVIWMSLVSTASWAQSLVANVERQTVIDGESVLLYIEGENLKSLPDVSALNRSFDILDSRQSNSQVFDRGEIRSKFTMRLELLPKNLGQVEIPVFTADGHSSQAIRVDVVERGTAGVTPRDKVFTEISFDTESPYVQSQVIMSLRILDDGSLATVDPQPPVIPDVQVERLPVGEQRIEERNGIEYRVHTWRYALFPQRHGEIEIPRMRIAGSVKDPGYGGNLILRNIATRRISISTDSAKLNVKQKPAQATSAWWLPIEQLELDRQWSADIAKAKVGEPLTLTLSVTTQGATSNQLPEILPPKIDGLKIYPDVPELLSQPDDVGLISRRREKWSVIPLREGVIEIPSVTIKWWDVNTDTEQTEVLPAQQLVVAAAGGGAVANSGQPVTEVQSAAIATSEDNAQATVADETPDSATSVSALPDRSEFWKWIAVIALAGWVLTLFSWWFRARRKSTTSDEAIEPVVGTSQHNLSQLNHVSNSGDVRVFRATLLDWAESYWPDDPPVNPAEIGRRLGQNSLEAQLRELDASLYSEQHGEVSLPQIYATLKSSIDHRNKDSKNSAADPLPTL